MSYLGAVQFLVQVALQAVSLVLILLEIPIVFDTGGEDCGVTFTFVLAVFYFSLATLRLLFHGTRAKLLGSSLYYMQFLVLPSLLVVHLGLCPSEILMNFASGWRLMLKYATGPFALLEGFCMLIVIQSCGRLGLVLSRRSDLFLLVQIVTASLGITVDIFLLLRIYALPAVVDVSSATLIGAALMLCLFLGSYGVVSKKGNVTESSLLLTYVVYVIYLTFTDFQSSDAPSMIFPFTEPLAVSDLPDAPTSRGVLDTLGIPLAKLLGQSKTTKVVPTAVAATTSTLPHIFDQDMPPLPPVIIDSFQNVMTTLAEVTPAAVQAIFRFLGSAVSAITPSVLISLAVRLGVFFLALRILPYVRHPNHDKLSWRTNPVLYALYSYAPCIMIAVYTHLLIQHFGGIVHVRKYELEAPLFDMISARNILLNSRASWKFWNWVNVFSTLAIYGYELVSSPQRAYDVILPTP